MKRFINGAFKIIFSRTLIVILMLLLQIAVLFFSFRLIPFGRDFASSSIISTAKSVLTDIFRVLLSNFAAFYSTLPKSGNDIFTTFFILPIAFIAGKC